MGQGQHPAQAISLRSAISAAASSPERPILAPQQHLLRPPVAPRRAQEGQGEHRRGEEEATRSP